MSDFETNQNASSNLSPGNVIADFLEELWRQAYARVSQMLDEGDKNAPCTREALEKIHKEKLHTFKFFRTNFNSSTTFSDFVYLGSLAAKAFDTTSGMGMDILTEAEKLSLIKRITESIELEKEASS